MMLFGVEMTRMGRVERRSLARLQISCDARCDDGSPRESSREHGMSLKSWRERRRIKRALATISGHSSQTMWLLVPFVPVLVLVVYVEGLSSKDQSHFNSVFWGLVAALIAAVFVFYQVERYRSLRLLTWLRDHRDELRTGEATFSGTTFSRTSELVQYEVCVSMFLLYAQFRTSYCVAGRSSVMKALSTVVVSLFGWWSLPGPFVTIKSLVVNLRGGHRVSVQDLLNQIPS